MQRKSNSDFRSNIELGGEGECYAIDAKLNDICVRTAKILNLDYCGIDVLFGENGYLVCEVNSNAFSRSAALPYDCVIDGLARFFIPDESRFPFLRHRLLSFNEHGR